MTGSCMFLLVSEFNVQLGEEVELGLDADLRIRILIWSLLTVFCIPGHGKTTGAKVAMVLEIQTQREGNNSIDCRHIWLSKCRQEVTTPTLILSLASRAILVEMY